MMPGRSANFWAANFWKKKLHWAPSRSPASPVDQWVYRAKQLWQRGENVYLAGLNEDGTHHQTKYLRREDYLPLGATVHMEGARFPGGYGKLSIGVA